MVHMAAKDEVEVRSPGFDYNMAAWCREKSHHIVMELAYLVDYLKDSEQIPDANRDETLSQISGVMYDATKLLSLMYGVQWSGAESDRIMGEGFAGYEHVAIQYGIIHGTSRTRRSKNVSEFIARFSEYLDGPRAPNRTYLHEVLLNYDIRSPLVEQLELLLEQVTNGELDWDDFVLFARELLVRLAQEKQQPSTSH